MRRSGAALVVAVVGAAVLAVPATATGAAYRYWSYWHWTGSTWEYAQRGPAISTPGDGSVEGWRFAAQVDASTGGVSPRVAGDFSTICGSTPAGSGKRVAVVIDFGTAADAPPLQQKCVRADAGASGLAVLTEAARAIRPDPRSGLVCGIAGYPKPPECGQTIASPEPTVQPTVPPTSPPPSPPRPSASQQPTTPASVTTPTPTPSSSPSDTPSPNGTEASPSPTVSAPTPHTATTSIPSDPPSKFGTPVGLLTGAGLVAALAGAALWLRGRRS